MQTQVQTEDNNTFDMATYEVFLSTADKTQITPKMEAQKKLIGVKVPKESVTVPESWPEIEKFLKDKGEINEQYVTAKKATQLPFVHPVMRATLIALEGANVIKDENQEALFKVMKEMVQKEMDENLTKLEKGLRDDKFNALYMEKVQHRVLIEKAHKEYNRIMKTAERTDVDKLLLAECECIILLDGNLDSLNPIYDEIHKKDKKA